MSRDDLQIAALVMMLVLGLAAYRRLRDAGAASVPDERPPEPPKKPADKPPGDGP
jgi:hypothetical protein